MLVALQQRLRELAEDVAADIRGVLRRLTNALKRPHYYLENDGGVYRAYSPAGVEVASGSTLLTVYDPVKAADRRIHFGPGTFTATGSLDLLSGMVVTGEGRLSHITRTTAGDLFRMVGTSGAPVEYAEVRGLRLSGPSTVNAQTAGSGVLLTFATRCRVERMHVTGFGSLGDEGAIRASDQTFSCTIRKNYCAANKNGIIAGAPGSATLRGFDLHILQNECFANFDDGIHTQRIARALIGYNLCHGHTVTGGSTDSAGIDVLGDENDIIIGNICHSNRRGMETGNTASGGVGDLGHVFSANKLFNNLDYGLTIIGKMANILFVGNSISNNGVNGVRWGSVNLAIDDVTLANNDIRNNGTYGIDLFGTPLRATLRGNTLSGHTTRDLHIRASTATPTNYTVEDNRFGSAGVPTNGGTGGRWNNNQGFETDSKGEGTIAANAATLVVNHGLALTPVSVQVTPSLGAVLWVTNRTATSFTVNRVSTSAAHPFTWRAEA